MSGRAAQDAFGAFLRTVREGDERAPERNTHTDACDGSRCPCYVQGQRDVVMAINVLRRLGMPLDDVLKEADDD